MARTLGATPKRGAGDGPGAIAAPSARQDHPSVPSTSEALIALGEEIGKLLARREMARYPHRRGYSLAELILGSAIVARALVLAWRLLGWHAH